MTIQTPEENNSTRHKAAGNLAFLLSVIRCGETLQADEEAHVREIINALTLEDDFTKHLMARHSDLAKSARALTERLYVVHDDPAYRAVWEIAQLYRGPYAGPTYTTELASLETLLRKNRMDAEGITEQDIYETRQNGAGLGD